MTIAVGQVGSYSNTLVSTQTSLQTSAVNTTATGSGFTIKALALSSSGTISFTAVDNFGNSYTHLGQQTFAAGIGTYSIDTWYCANGTGGAGHQATLTPTYSNGASYRGVCLVALIEETGAALASIYDQTTSQSYPYSASPPYATTSLTVTPPATGTLLISSALLSFSSTSATPSESTGFTVQNYYDPATAIAFAIGTKVVTAPGTYTPSWTGTSAVEAFIGIDSFNGATAAGPLPVSSLSSMGFGPG
jgi:hypothetical protein